MKRRGGDPTKGIRVRGSLRVEELALGALPWLACAIALLPVVRGGFPQGHDWIFELVRAAEYRHALSEGQLPPTWAPDLYAGYGSPIFVFYAPLFSAASALASFVVEDMTRAAAFVLGIAAVCSVLAMQRLVREALPSAPSAAARVAAGFFVLHPYLICDALLRNADAEYLALALSPLPLAGVLAAARRPRAAMLWTSAGIALVILSHNLTALWVTALAVAFAGLAQPKGARVRALLPCAAGIALGLALSAGFWLPALALTSQVRTEALVEGKFDFHRQFPSFLGAFGYGRFFATGLLTPLVFAAAAVALGRGADARERRLLALALAGAAVCAFLLLPASAPVWERAPFLRYFQFPWRWLGPIALLGSLCAASSFAVLFRRASPRARLAAELAILALCVANALPHLLDAQPIASRIRARLPELLTREGIATQDLAATVGDEYLPRVADPRAWRDATSAGPVAGISGPLEANVVLDTGVRVELVTRSKGPAQLELRRFWFPGWRVEIDGSPAEHGASARGALLVSLDGGEKSVVALLEPTPIASAARSVSLVAAVAWLLLLVGPPVRRALA